MRLLNYVLPALFLMASTSVFALPEKNTVNSPEEGIAKLETMLDQFSRENLEKEKGGKLKLGEKIVAGLIRKKIKKKIKRIEKGKDDGLAVGSIALGGAAILAIIIGLFVPGLFFVGLLLSIIGLTLGIVAKKKTDSPMASGGVVLNAATLAVGLVILLIAAIWVATIF